MDNDREFEKIHGEITGHGYSYDKDENDWQYKDMKVQDDWVFYCATLSHSKERIAEFEKLQPVVSVCEMNESNGNKWFSVYLFKNEDQTIFDAYQVYQTKIKGRAEYEAAQLRHTLGQAEHPNILDFDTDDIDQANEGK